MASDRHYLLAQRLPMERIRVAPAGLSVGLKRHGDCLVVQLAGELELATRATVATTIAEALTDQVRQVVIDARGLTLCDSIGVSTLVNLRRTAEADGRQLRIANLKPQVRRAMEITGTLPDQVNGQAVEHPGEPAAGPVLQSIHLTWLARLVQALGRPAQTAVRAGSARIIRTAGAGCAAKIRSRWATRPEANPFWAQWNGLPRPHLDRHPREPRLTGRAGPVGRSAGC
jgi:anti-anti-sigma factor